MKQAGSRLAELEEELDQQGPISRDEDTVQSQIDEINVSIKTQITRVVPYKCVLLFVFCMLVSLSLRPKGL